MQIYGHFADLPFKMHCLGLKMACVVCMVSLLSWHTLGGPSTRRAPFDFSGALLVTHQESNP